MLRAQHSLVVFALALFPIGCTPAGCAGEDPEQDKSATDQFAGAIEQTLPAPVPGTPLLYGTWSGPKEAGRIDMIVLMTNGSYHTSQNVVCAKAPCDPITSDGTFKLFTRDKRTYLELNGAAASREVSRYEYAASSNTLRLRPLVAGSEWFALDHSGIAWCSSERECNFQNLPPGICAGGYKCEQNACNWKCIKNDEPSVAPPTAPPAAVNPGDTKTP